MQIGNYEFDATISEQATLSSKKTSYPIENGLLVTDFIADEPIKLQAQAVLTDTPFRSLTDDIAYTVGAFIGSQALPESLKRLVSIGNAVSSKFTGDQSLKTRSALAWQELCRLKNTRQSFDILTSKRIYKNMIIMSMTQKTDATNANALVVDFTFEEDMRFEEEAEQPNESNMVDSESFYMSKTEDMGYA